VAGTLHAGPDDIADNGSAHATRPAPDAHSSLTRLRERHAQQQALPKRRPRHYP